MRGRGLRSVTFQLRLPALAEARPCPYVPPKHVDVLRCRHDPHALLNVQLRQVRPPAGDLHFGASRAVSANDFDGPYALRHHERMLFRPCDEYVADRNPHHRLGHAADEELRNGRAAECAEDDQI